MRDIVVLSCAAVGEIGTPATLAAEHGHEDVENVQRNGNRRKPPLSVPEARATLERLREATAAASPNQLAPPLWIAEMHRALRAIAPQDEVQRRRVDGLAGMDMAYLHKRVQSILNDFDYLVAQNPRLQPHYL